VKQPWWSGLHDTWSKQRVAYLVSTNQSEHPADWLGDFVFHRFYSTDEYDPKYVKTFLVEAKRWSQWQEWLETHKTDTKTLVPKYVHPLEQVIMSCKGFRIVQWVDEYRPFEFEHDALI